MTQEQKNNMLEALEAEDAAVAVIVELSENQIAALNALRIDKRERESFAVKATNQALRSAVGSKVTSLVKRIYDETRKGNAGNVTMLTESLRNLEAIFEKL